MGFTNLDLYLIYFRILLFFFLLKISKFIKVFIYSFLHLKFVIQSIIFLYIINFTVYVYNLFYKFNNHYFYIY